MAQRFEGGQPSRSWRRRDATRIARLQPPGWKRGASAPRKESRREALFQCAAVSAACSRTQRTQAQASRRSPASSPWRTSRGAARQPCRVEMPITHSRIIDFHFSTRQNLSSFGGVRAAMRNPELVDGSLFERRPGGPHSIERLQPPRWKRGALAPRKEDRREAPYICAAYPQHVVEAGTPQDAGPKDPALHLILRRSVISRH
jgi:hypothetical protein